MRRLLLVLPLWVVGFSGCLPVFAPDPKVPKLTGTFRVLFVGNSHSYVQDLSGLVQSVARQAGNTELQTARVAFPDYALEDHANEGTVMRALRGSDWEYVVMQQGPSALPESQNHLRFWTTWWAPYITAANATPVLYQVWPSTARRFDAEGTLISYTNAAAAVGGILAPAGDAFTAAIAANASVGVYAGDGFHASSRGAYVAALVIVGRLLEIDVETLPDEIPGYAEPASVVQALQAAAATALNRNAVRPGPIHEVRR
jgi:cell wall-associated NlpC family hydrolase